MNLEIILAYGFMFLFAIGTIGFMLYVVFALIYTSIKKHMMFKEIFQSPVDQRRYRFMKKLWH